MNDRLATLSGICSSMVQKLERHDGLAGFVVGSSSVERKSREEEEEGYVRDDMMMIMVVVVVIFL